MTLEEIKEMYPVGTVFIPNNWISGNNRKVTVEKGDIIKPFEWSSEIKQGYKLERRNAISSILRDSNGNLAKIISKPEFELQVGKWYSRINYPGVYVKILDSRSQIIRSKCFITSQLIIC